MNNHLKLVGILLMSLAFFGTAAHAELRDLLKSKAYLPKKGTNFKGSFQPNTIGIDKPDLEQNRYVDDGRDGGTTIIDPPGSDEDECVGISKCSWHHDHPGEIGGGWTLDELCEYECALLWDYDDYMMERAGCIEHNNSNGLECNCMTHSEFQAYCNAGGWAPGQ